MTCDLAMSDEWLATTRAERKRRDLSREVPRKVIMEYLELWAQAPAGSHSPGWRRLIADDRKSMALAGTEMTGV
jgi:hypothetical protein